MTTTILILIACSTVITTIINFSKPGYEKLVKKKYVGTISIGLAFILGLIAAFSIQWGWEISAGMKVLLGLALGTGSTIWYDFWEVIKSFERKTPEEE